MSTSTPTRPAANDVRNRNAAARTIALLAEYFAAGDTEGATEEMLAAGHARLGKPQRQPRPARRHARLDPGHLLRPSAPPRRPRPPHPQPPRPAGLNRGASHRPRPHRPN